MPTRRSVLGLALAATTAMVGGAIQLLSAGAGQAFADPVSGLGGGSYARFASGKLWLNSLPITQQPLHSKVALVDLWTYSCINALRPLLLWQPDTEHPLSKPDQI